MIPLRWRKRIAFFLVALSVPATIALVGAATWTAWQVGSAIGDLLGA